MAFLADPLLPGAPEPVIHTCANVLRGAEPSLSNHPFKRPTGADSAVWFVLRPVSSVAQWGLELQETRSLCHLNARIKGVHHHGMLYHAWLQG